VASSKKEIQLSESSVIVSAADPRDINLSSCRLTATGIRFDSRPTFEEWEAAGAFLQRCEGAVQWWIGDWLIHGEGRPEWGDKYEQAISLFGKDYDTIAEYKRVADAFQITERSVNLPWSAHLAVASLPTSNRTELLAEAERDELSVADVRKRAREARGRLIVQAAPSIPPGTYSLIYADPPWRYNEATVDPTRQIENQYPTMELEAIKALPVATVAAPNCVLFMWTTQPKLSEAMEVIKAWGFDYRSGVVWDKKRMGMGHYFRIRTEHLLLAVKGSPGTPAQENRVENLIEAPRGEHSKKPELFYELLERLYPNAVRLELFARGSRPGWNVWGNEVAA
jgi:N6-adenosine-specific RNA methylase IME4